MKNNTLITEFGTIGVSGRFYPCYPGEHQQTTWANKRDSPHVTVGYIDKHEAYAHPAGCPGDYEAPTNEQFETVMDWCIKYSVRFEYACKNRAWWKFTQPLFGQLKKEG